MVLFTIIAPLPISESQRTNGFISLVVIGGLLLLCAVGVRLWRLWWCPREPRDIAAGNVNEHGDTAVGAQVEGRPQSDGVTEEGTREGGRWSGESLMEGRWADRIEPNDGELELRAPPRAYIR